MICHRKLCNQNQLHAMKIIAILLGVKCSHSSFTKSWLFLSHKRSFKT
uniref:Uncharacterized protein n=1 Tax=Anguilla anguilla TaxID=7936 RepID=A0A0E9X0G5_ANGAN